MVTEICSFKCGDPSKSEAKMWSRKTPTLRLSSVYQHFSTDFFHLCLILKLISCRFFSVFLDCCNLSFIVFYFKLLLGYPFFRVLAFSSKWRHCDTWLQQSDYIIKCTNEWPNWKYKLFEHMFDMAARGWILKVSRFFFWAV